MWTNQFRSKPSMEYRKKYRCTKCQEYTLYVINDNKCVCKNHCDTYDIDIKNIMKKNDFNKYFTTEELKNSFSNYDEKANNILEKCLVDTRPYVINTQQINKLYKLEKRAHNTYEILDDLASIYKNKYEVNPNNINDFAYMINLIEDINYFIIRCLNDIILINYGIKYADQHFKSGRFFYNNAIDHLFLANERIYILMGIIYKYKFDKKLINNNTFIIKSHLKNCNQFQNKTKRFIEDTDKNFEQLSKIKGNNTHSLSNYSKIILDDIEKNGNKGREFWNRNGNEVDKDLLIPKIYIITNYLEKIYDTLDELFSEIYNNLDEYNKKTLPMIDKFMKIDNINTNSKKYAPDDFNALTLKAIKIRKKSIR